MFSRGSPALIKTIAWVGFATAWTAQNSSAETAFFMQREGSANDTGLADFLTASSPIYVQDFENPELRANGTQLSGVMVGELGLSWTCVGNGPFQPFLAASTAFNAPNKIHNYALVAFGVLTITPDPNTPVAALGAWIFDDGRAADSAYLVQVVELDGTIWESLLVNEIPLNSRGHEIEGFIGAVSSVGIASLTITPIDPVTGLFQLDTFELDYLMASPLPPPPPPPPPPPDDEQQNGDGELDEDAVDQDDNATAPDDRCLRHPRRHHRHPHVGHSRCRDRDGRHPGNRCGGHYRAAGGKERDKPAKSPPAAHPRIPKPKRTGRK